MVAPWVVSGELWERVEPLLPVCPAGKTGPKPLDDRRVLQGILFVLYTGIGWEDLPQELGFGSGMTCWRRLRDWQAAGVFDRLHEVLLAQLHAAGPIDWSRACADASHIRTKKKGARPRGRALLDRGTTGAKHHLICDGGGIPLAVILTGGNRHDSTQLLPLVEAIPPVRGRRGRPRRKPDMLVAHRGYDDEPYREQLRQRGITPLISRKRTRDTNQPVRCCGTHPGTAAPVPTSGDPVGTPHRHPPRLPRPGHQPHLLAPTTQPNTLGT
ncbi:Transposase, partial [Actinopolyspora xinjiangensis]